MTQNAASQYRIAMSAGRDAANRQMRKAGRSVWNQDDYATAAAEANRLLDVLA